MSRQLGKGCVKTRFIWLPISTEQSQFFSLNESKEESIRGKCYQYITLIGSIFVPDILENNSQHLILFED